MSPTSSPPLKGGEFFIIGAQRSGTTYLYELLEDHPQVRMAHPERPEPKWFLDKAKVSRGAEGWRRELFPQGTGLWSGEKGTSYIEYPEAARAILSIFPEARFMVILREPVARALSNYRFSLDNRVETWGLREALDPRAPERSFDRNQFSVSPYTYLARGFYLRYLEPWTRIVPKDRIHVVIFEELVHGEKILRELREFLGISPHHPQALGRVVNAAKEPMPEIPGDLLRNLRALYEGPNRELEKFLGRSLELWKG